MNKINPIINDIRIALGLKDDNGTIVKTSTIPDAGSGLFAKIKFRVGDFIDFYTGTIIYDINELPRDNAYLFHNIEGNFYIDGKFGNSIRYINHNDSELCNCAYKYYMLPDINILYPIVICIKDVEVGEELFCDYGKYYTFF